MRSSNSSTTQQNTKENEKQIYIDNTKINYLKTGHGQHNVILNPGVHGTVWMHFEPQVNGFDPKEFTVIGWDPPGYGGSRPAERDFSIGYYERDADIAAKLLKALDVEKCSVLGWCEGGVTSMIMAAKYPELVNQLVIWGTRAFLTDEDMDTFRGALLNAVIKTYSTRVRDLNKWPTPTLNKSLAVYDRQTLQTIIDKWLDAWEEIKEKCQGDLCQGWVDKITAPTLILHGEKDRFTPKYHCHFLLEHIKGSKFYSFPDGEHSFHLKHAGLFNKVVQSFLQNGQI